MVEAGLDGIECFHTKHSTSISEHYLQIADEHNLLVTGGSDCHGMNKGKPLIGTRQAAVSACGAAQSARRSRANLSEVESSYIG